MKNGMIEKINKVNRTAVENELKAFGEMNNLSTASMTELKKEFDQTAEYVASWFTGKDTDGKPSHNRSVKMEEATTTADFPLLMRRVISEQMIEPVEPVFFLRNNVARSMDFGFDYPAYTEFPGIGYVTADVVAENGQYPDVTPAMMANRFSIRLRKYGLKMNLSDETIRHSIYPIVALYMKIGKAGIERKSEEELSKQMKANAHVVFNNSSSDSTYYTTGKDVDGKTNNFSFSYYDLFFMMQSLVANRYQGTHLLVHPLGYGVLMNDPWLRNYWLNGGQIGGGLWDKAPAQDAPSSITPFQLNYVPYYNVDFSPSATLASANVSGNALAATFLTDLYVIDKNNSLIFAHGGGIEEDQIADWFTDSRCIKLRQYMDFGTLDRGFGMMRAKDIRVVKNYEPVVSIRQVS